MLASTSFRVLVLAAWLGVLATGCEAFGVPLAADPPADAEEHMPLWAGVDLRGDPPVAGQDLELTIVAVPDDVPIRSIDVPMGTVVRWHELVGEGPIRLTSTAPGCTFDVDLPPERSTPIVFRHDAAGCTFAVADPVETGEAGHLAATVTALPWDGLLVEAVSLDDPRQPVPEPVPPDEGGLAQLDPLWPGRYEIRLRRGEVILERHVIQVAPTGPQDSLISLTLDGAPD
jgi:hypothetical protein